MKRRITLCPACGYDLGFIAWNGDSPSDEICPCCGIQFGYSDEKWVMEGTEKTFYEGWRAKWIADGMKWSSEQEAPDGWNAEDQLTMLKKAQQ